MFPLLYSPLSLIIAFTTGVGVLVHDTQIDKAASLAIALPAIVATYSAVDKALKTSDAHTHVERVTIGGSNHRIQPRVGDDKKYIVLKKFGAHSLNGEYSWPSI